ncbi:MAG TPA: GNAT family N-acetyltransferase [Pseudonocardiaceae bacterium]
MELREVQSCLRATIESRSTKVGPFLVLLSSATDNPFSNYAVPLDGAAPTGDDVTALIGFFTDRKRLPRLEYVRPAPAVDAALAAAGFDVAGTLTLMAIEHEPAPPPDAAGYEVRLVTSEPELRQAVAVQNTAYGEPDTEANPDFMVRNVADGGAVALAVETATGAPAGAGAYTPAQGGLVEIAGVGVTPEHRRHGVGALVTWTLSAEASRLGHQPFLQVEKADPLRVYQRIGYRVIGDMADARRVLL